MFAIMNVALNKLYDGIVLITIGIVLVLNIGGWVDWSIWLFYLNFWPLILIVAGFKLILSVKKNYVNIAIIIQTILWIVVFFAGIIYTIKHMALPGNTVMNYYATVLSDNSERLLPVSYNLNMGIGEYTITNASDNAEHPELAVSGQYSQSLGQPALSKKVVNTNTDATLQLSYDMEEQSFTFGVFNSNTYKMDMQLGKQQIESLDMDLGVGKTTLNLNGLKAGSVSTNIGVGEITLNINDASQIHSLDVKVGVGQATIVLPKDAIYDLDYQAGLGSTNLNDQQLGGVGSKGSTTNSTNLELETKNIIHITANVGIGQIIIKNASN
jgi:hypothetical protein